MPRTAPTKRKPLPPALPLPAKTPPQEPLEPVAVNGIQTVCGGITVTPEEHEGIPMLVFTCACGKGRCSRVANGYRGLGKDFEDWLQAWMLAAHEGAA